MKIPRSKKWILLGIFPALGKIHSEILPVLQARSGQDKKSQTMCREAMGFWFIADPMLSVAIAPGGPQA